ncbi:hypothetical protein LXL04_014315 [Taraxacum kok-saghyz]
MVLWRSMVTDIASQCVITDQENRIVSRENVLYCSTFASRDLMVRLLNRLSNDVVTGSKGRMRGFLLSTDLGLLHIQINNSFSEMYHYHLWVMLELKACLNTVRCDILNMYKTETYKLSLLPRKYRARFA